MITPLQYEDRYKTLKVEFIATDTPPVTLSITKYRLGKMTPEGSRFVTAARDYFHQQQKKAFDFTLALIVNGQPATFGMWEDLAPHVQPPFSGKGSPEDCQIVAQMAVLLNRTTAANLQTYCDTNIGLDCNGFVGNYLWHVRGKKDWMDIAGEHDLGPGMSIDGFFDKGRPSEVSTRFSPPSSTCWPRKQHQQAHSSCCRLEPRWNLERGGPHRHHRARPFRTSHRYREEYISARPVRR